QRLHLPLDECWRRTEKRSDRVLLRERVPVSGDGRSLVLRVNLHLVAARETLIHEIPERRKLARQCLPADRLKKLIWIADKLHDARSCAIPRERRKRRRRDLLESRCDLTRLSVNNPKIIHAP